MASASKVNTLLYCNSKSLRKRIVKIVRSQNSKHHNMVVHRYENCFFTPYETNKSSVPICFQTVQCVWCSWPQHDLQYHLQGQDRSFLVDIRNTGFLCILYFRDVVLPIALYVFAPHQFSGIFFTPLMILFCKNFLVIFQYCLSLSENIPVVGGIKATLAYNQNKTRINFMNHLRDPLSLRFTTQDSSVLFPRLLYSCPHRGDWNSHSSSPRWRSHPSALNCFILKSQQAAGNRERSQWSHLRCRLNTEVCTGKMGQAGVQSASLTPNVAVCHGVTSIPTDKHSQARYATFSCRVYKVWQSLEICAV